VPITKGINDHDRPRFVDPVALMGKAYRVSFSYAGNDRIWHDSWTQENELPKAIRVTIREVHTRHILGASTALLLHVASPVDCINAKSQAECLALRAPNAQSAGSPTARATNSGSSP
jgi:general secretion pathway protein J